VQEDVNIVRCIKEYTIYGGRELRERGKCQSLVELHAALKLHKRDREETY